MGSESQGIQGQKDSVALAVFERMVGSANRHDMEGLVACFSRDFQGEEPWHPERNHVGKAGVRKHWGEFLQASPDLRLDVLSLVIEDDTVWSELHIHGTQASGGRRSARGVAIQRVRDGLIVWARLYLETPSLARAGAD